MGDALFEIRELRTKEDAQFMAELKEWLAVCDEYKVKREAMEGGVRAAPIDRHMQVRKGPIGSMEHELTYSWEDWLKWCEARGIRPGTPERPTRAFLVPDGYKPCYPAREHSLEAQPLNIPLRHLKAKCECGSAACGSSAHSDWCPLYNKRG